MLDNASISALVAEHGRWLMAFLRGLVGDASDAEDAFQEVWVRLMRSRAEFRGDGARTYLARTARSVAIDRLRRRRPVESLDAMGDCEDGVASGVELPDDAPGPAMRCESKATAQDVRDAVAALPFKWRQVVLMRIEAEMEFKDIAAELDIPLGTALTWMRRATMELKRRLGGVK